MGFFLLFLQLQEPPFHLPILPGILDWKMKRYRNGEIWDFEEEMQLLGDGFCDQREVILGLDGDTTCTVCVCMPLIPFADDLPDPPPILSRAVAGCSNHNSVGGISFCTFLRVFYLNYYCLR